MRQRRNVQEKSQPSFGAESWFLSVACCSVAQSCLTLCNTMDCSIPGFLHYLHTGKIALNCFVYTEVPSRWEK